MTSEKHHSLADLQRQMADALQSPEAVHQDLLAQIKSDRFSAAERFQVHQNNVRLSLTDSVVDSFPVSASFIGEDFFRGVARAYVQAGAPTDPRLSEYAPAFADFWMTFEPAQDYAFIGDLIRLEAAIDRVQELPRAYPAGDDVWAEFLAELSTDGSDIAQFEIGVCGSAAHIESVFPLLELWLVATGQMDADDLDMDQQARHFIVLNVEGDVIFHEVENTVLEFYQALLKDGNLLAAYQAVIEQNQDETINLETLLIEIFQKRILTQFKNKNSR